VIAVGETDPGAAEIPFFLPLASDPINSGLTGHDFTSNSSTGEVQIKLPGGSWFNVAGSQIVEKGFGRYCVQLTESQCATAGMAYIRAVISGNTAQPYSGNEEIGTLGGDIPVNGSDVFTFDLPNGTDPVFGSPITGHTFSSGEVKICVPGGSYTNATLGDIAEIGNGLYTLAIHGTETANRGKVFVYVNVSGSQRFEGYVTVLGSSTGGTASIAFVTPDPNTTPGSGGGFSADYETAALTPIVVQVTDVLGAGAIAFVEITALIYGGASETVFRGQFAGGYSEGSSQTEITDGTQYTITRSGGWPGGNAESNLAVGLIVDVINTSGEIVSSTAYYEMPTQGVIPTAALQPIPQPQGLVDHVAQALDYVADQFRSRQ
jgi:hypothetical protein